MVSGSLFTQEKKAQLLLVDDEPEILDIMKQRLQSKGYAVVTARDGSEALFKFKNQVFDLVITDLAMPKATGMDLIQSIRSLDRRGLDADIPVIIVSGNIADYKAEILLYDNLTILEKPITGDELNKKIKEVLIQKAASKKVMAVDKVLLSVSQKIMDVSKQVLFILFKQGIKASDEDIDLSNSDLSFHSYSNFILSYNDEHIHVLFNFKEYLIYKISYAMKPEIAGTKEKFTLNKQILELFHLFTTAYMGKVLTALKNEKIELKKYTESIGGTVGRSNKLYLPGNFSGKKIMFETAGGPLEVYSLIKIKKPKDLKSLS